MTARFCFSGSQVAFVCPSSELVALTVAELTFVREGLEVFIVTSKTDQERTGAMKVVAFGSDPSTCPVRAVKDWLELSAVYARRVFSARDACVYFSARAPHSRSH